eukprot:14505591-Heterocapsa_arctica.AAC.1
MFLRVPACPWRALSQLPHHLPGNCPIYCAIQSIQVPSTFSGLPPDRLRGVLYCELLDELR